MSNPNRRFTRDDDLAALKRAAESMRAMTNPPRLTTALAELMEKTAWMGGLDPDMLSRIPCDEVIAVAHAYLDQENSDA